MGIIYLLKKFRREIFKENGSQLLSLIIIVAIGITCFIGFSKSSSDLEKTVSDYYRHSNLEDLEVSGNFSAKKVRQIQNIAGIKKIAKNYDYQASVKKNNLLINGYSKSNKINQLTLLAGNYPRQNEIAVDHLYFEKNQLKIGDQVKLLINGLRVKAKISGTIRSPKYLYLTENAAEPFPNHQKYGYGVIPNKRLKKLGLPVNSLVIKVGKSSSSNQVIDRLHAVDRNAFVVKRQDLMSYNMIHSKLTTIKNIAIVISAVFILLTIAVTLISYSKQVSNKRGEIAIFKALGVSRKNILIYLFFPGIVTAIVGTAIGSLIGILIFPQIINQTLGNLFDFPKIMQGNYLSLVAGSFIAVLVVELIALVINAAKLLNESAANTMRPTISKAKAGTFLAKIPGIWRHLSFKSKLLVRNIASGKIKFLFSALAIAFCVTILISSFGLKFAFGNIEQTEFQDVRKYDLSANLTSNKQGKISQDPSVVYVDNYAIVPAKVGNTETHLNVINAKAKAINLSSTSNEKLSFAHLQGTYISAKLAQRLALKKGSTVKLKVFHDNEYDNFKTVIKGIYTSYMSQGFYTTDDYLKSKGLNIPVQTKFIKAKNIKGEKQRLDKNPLVKNVLLKSKQAQGYQKASTAVNSILIMIVLIAALLLFAVIYNLSTINIAERKRDIATEKVLGLSSGNINRLILGENTILVTAATVIGIIISPWMYNLLGNSIASDDMSFPTQLNLNSIPISIGLIILFLLLTSLFLIQKIKKINQLEALNGFE
ncbi:ABC transporter permease [Lactobacillus xylocopicola]|uniref:ABC3 transporter permease C-terminal domain-containing protein n=1 Tax=Lactobacillus xylocopicola TaxID=2976676 RepID=A0ABM8BEX7_9LACO|nr:FtsX-like permease family protein [Lactobacillus xylocopicola]BDR59796.1 hypothetical protein KIM322_00570 [Lactobacillus xylocopicola]